MKVRFSRRQFLATTALAGVGAALVAPRPARALRLEEDIVAERLYFSACEARSAHDQLAQKLIAELETQEGHDKAVEIVQAMKCPVCGCRLVPTDNAS